MNHMQRRCVAKPRIAGVQAKSIQDPFKLLGVEPDADEKKVKKAYRKLALRYHPDVNKHDLAEAKFKALREAYELLMGKGSDSGDGRRAPFGGNWDFHDWYWSFSMKQRQSRQGGGGAAHSSQAAQAHRGKVQEQMANLKRRAATRRARSAGAPEGFAGTHRPRYASAAAPPPEAPSILNMPPSPRSSSHSTTAAPEPDRDQRSHQSSDAVHPQAHSPAVPQADTRAKSQTESQAQGKGERVVHGADAEWAAAAQWRATIHRLHVLRRAASAPEHGARREEEHAAWAHIGAAFDRHHVAVRVASDWLCGRVDGHLDALRQHLPASERPPLSGHARAVRAESERRRDDEAVMERYVGGPRRGGGAPGVDESGGECAAAVATLEREVAGDRAGEADAGAEGRGCREGEQSRRPGFVASEERRQALRSQLAGLRRKSDLRSRSNN